MPHYAMLQGQNVVAVQEAESSEFAPVGSIELTAWRGWPDKPSPHHVLRIVSGSLVWQEHRTADQAWADIRAKRDALLGESDWRVTRATETGISVTTEWLAYRQALRDVTQQIDPFNITWPVPPNE